MIPFKLSMLVIIVILIFLLIMRKRKGLRGTWDKRQDIEEFALIMKEPIIPDKIIQNNIIPDKIIPDKIIPDNIQDNGFESIGEKICRNHLERKFHTKFSKDRPNFLKNPITKNNLELDCFSKELKLALEYNGKQHYEFVPKFHKTKTDFYNQKYRDEIKKRLCLENGIDLIEVPYTVTHSEIPNYIDSALKKLNKF